MPTIYIDNQLYEVKEGLNLLQACLSLGFDIPYFCWHPAMGSVGACRQCAVKLFKDEEDKKGRIVMSCMTPADDGTRISIDDPEVKEFRKSVIEWLMVNHPHDCPVCDEGGECHLQDMTVMTGHNYRRYRFRKRTYPNQNLGPFVNHEMNRCIQCYRCVRFYRNYAGGRDLSAFGCHDHVYFGRGKDGILENEFSGNLVEICPTGVFTDKTLKRHYTRKWDLQTAPSVCVHCSLGCNTIPGERYGELRRIRNRYHHEINGYFLCDRGRYGYEFVNSSLRIRRPLRRVRKKDAQKPVPQDIALAMAGVLVKKGRVIGIGSPRASLESNFVLRQLVAPDNFYAGVPDGEWHLMESALGILRQGPVRIASLKEAAEADAVFVLGENVSDTAPILALKLRQLIHVQAARIARRTKIPGWDDAGLREVAQQEKETLFIATSYPTRLDDTAKSVCHIPPAGLVRLGFQVAHLIDPSAPAVDDLPVELSETARAVADALKQAQRPLVVSGTGYGDPKLLEAAANIARALDAGDRDARILFAFSECNSLGTGLLGSAGGLGSAQKVLGDGAADTVILLENDLFYRMDEERARDLFHSARHVICLDHLRHQSAERADLVLPAAAFAEASGTLVNNEGRAQRFFRVFDPGEDIRESWRWLIDIMAAAGRNEAGRWRSLDDVLAAMAEAIPLTAGLREAAPDASFRITGAKVSRQSHRYSGRTAMHADIRVHEPVPEEDPDAPLCFSMEGHEGLLTPSALIPRFWRPGWNSVQSLNKFQEEIAGPLRRGDAGKRLIQPSSGMKARYFLDIPPNRELAENERHLVPIYHVFGSEALSLYSPAVASRAPAPYVALSPQDAQSLGIQADESVIVTVRESILDLPVRLLPGLTANTAGLPANLPGMPSLYFPETVRIERRKNHA